MSAWFLLSSAMGSFLKSCSTHRVMPVRTIWAWLNNVFNKSVHYLNYAIDPFPSPILYDKSRVDAVGPDLACAEWLLRCGAQVRWVDSTKWYSDYNSLPKAPQEYKIGEIDATDSAVMTIGFLHLKGLTHLEKIRFHKCFYLDDDALAQLSYVKNTLKDLHISSCGDITDKGIANLFDLSQLKKLHLFDLIGVKDRTGCLQLITKALPNCTVTFPETPH